ncbi:MAG: chorismate mutase [Candidatus Woesearchaeota archaeon]|nr:chorismate mutase [Candidatus Woesearchaeota archaeon]
MTLENLREKIDEIDEEIILLIKKRIDMCPMIVEQKLKNKMKISQSKREVEILEQRQRLAIEAGLNPNTIEQIFRLIIEESKEVQKKLIDEQMNGEEK